MTFQSPLIVENGIGIHVSANREHHVATINFGLMEGGKSSVGCGVTLQTEAAMDSLIKALHAAKEHWVGEPNE